MEKTNQTNKARVVYLEKPMRPMPDRSMVELLQLAKESFEYAERVYNESVLKNRQNIIQ